MPAAFFPPLLLGGLRRLAEEGTEAAFQQLKALTEEAERERLEELGAGEGLATS